MKRVIGLTLAAVLIAGIAGGGTWAYFSDGETSQNNTLTAGSLDLQVGATDPCTESIDIGSQIQPGDSGNAADWTLTNLGDVSGKLKVEISPVLDYENTWLETEQAAGDSSGSCNIAVDDFESGGTSGGSGWLAGWYLAGDGAVTTMGGPHSGSYHLMVRRASGYVDRAVDLSGQSDVHLRFWAKADSFEEGEFAECSVSSNGSDWDVVHTWIDGDDDNIYHFFDIDLSGYTMSGTFYVAFDAEMGQNTDYLYIDDVEFINTSAGELGDSVSIAVWLDTDRSGGWNSGDMYLKSDGTVVNWVSGASLPSAAYDDINNYAGLDWESADGMPTIIGSGALDFMVEYDFPINSNDDRAQSDSSAFDITFTLEQV